MLNINMTFIKILLLIFFSLVIIFFFFNSKITESFVTVDDIPDNVKKEIGKAYNVVVLSEDQKILPYIQPAKTRKIDPYDNLSVCTIDRQFKKYQDYSIYYDDNKKREKEKPNEKIINKNKKKKFYDNYYGIVPAPDSNEYEQIMQENKEEEYPFIQGNICKLSPWSLWSDCDTKCGKNYGKKTRTRTVLKEPVGCYSPLNPLLSQTIPCNSTLCFCNSC